MLRSIINSKSIAWEIEYGITIEKHIKNGSYLSKKVEDRFIYLQRLQETGKIEPYINITLLDSFILVGLKSLTFIIKYNESNKRQIRVPNKSIFRRQENYLTAKYNDSTLEIIYSDCKINIIKVKNFVYG